MHIEHPIRVFRGVRNGVIPGNIPIALSAGIRDHTKPDHNVVLVIEIIGRAIFGVAVDPRGCAVMIIGMLGPVGSRECLRHCIQVGYTVYWAAYSN